MSLDLYSKVLYSLCFYCMASWGLSKYIETELVYFELVYLSHFLHNFWKNYFSCNIVLIDQISLSGYLYFVRHLAICVLQLFVIQVVTSWILKLTVSFKSSRFSYMSKKLWQKLKYLENEKSIKSIKRWNKKYFSSFF